MAGIIYVFDTSAITDVIKKQVTILNHIATRSTGNVLYLAQPVDYEIRRGFISTNATARLRDYNKYVKPNFRWLALEDEDWEQAAQFWADTKTKGKQLSDMDLLLAAVVYRRNAILVSSDTDFDTAN